MTIIKTLRELALRTHHVNPEGLTWREWYDALHLTDNMPSGCRPNAWGSCTSLCGHAPESASPELLSAWNYGEDPTEWRQILADRHLTTRKR